MKKRQSAKKGYFTVIKEILLNKKKKVKIENQGSLVTGEKNRKSSGG